MASLHDTLRASAPAATKSEHQGGYPVDWLKPSHSHLRPDLQDGKDDAPWSQQDGKQDDRQDPQDGKDDTQRNLDGIYGVIQDIEHQQQLPPAKVRWYRTRRGIIILSITSLAVVGGAVGGDVASLFEEGAGGGGAASATHLTSPLFGTTRGPSATRTILPPIDPLPSFRTTGGF